MRLSARKRLQAVKEAKKFYTDKDIKGIGKNYMSEKVRVNGIEAYTFYIKYYALKALLAKTEKLATEGKAVVDAPCAACANWEHARAILASEFAGEKCPKTLLKQLGEMQSSICKDVETSKAKDDERGAKVIPGYATAHKPAVSDGFVKETKTVTEEMLKKIADVTAKLS